MSMGTNGVQRYVKFIMKKKYILSTGGTYNSTTFCSPEGIKVDLKENGIEENGSSEQYKKLLDLGLVEQVAEKLDSIYSEGLVKVRLHGNNVVA